jgi:hypothetical protein
VHLDIHSQRDGRQADANPHLMAIPGLSHLARVFIAKESQAQVNSKTGDASLSSPLISRSPRVTKSCDVDEEAPQEAVNGMIENTSYAINSD